MGSRPPAFDGAAGSWGTHRIRLEAFFEGHEVTDPGKRRALLISSLSDSVVRVLQGRNPSIPVNSLSYDQVVECLEEAEDFARASEKAREDVRDMQETGVGNGSGTMNALQRLRRCESRPPSSNLESSRPRCERCDGPHDSNVCRHRNTKCRQCGRKGHLARVCHTSRSRTSGAYVMEEDESENEEFMLALMAHTATDRDVSRPLEKVLTWGGQKLSMIIDTGSPVSDSNECIRETQKAVASSHKNCPAALMLSWTPARHWQVKSGTVTVTSTLVVVGCQGPLLCGRRTIEEFCKAGVSLLDAKKC
ncbi:hypothetical protein MTO96_048936 [Rhipicephalus appendiculatus]